MKLMKNVTTAVVILSTTCAQLAFAAPSKVTLDDAVKNYRASVESGTLNDTTASNILVKQLVDNNVKMSDISAWVEQNSTPKKYQQFNQALFYAMTQVNGQSNMSNSEIQSVLSNAMIATDQEGVHWKSCALKVTSESILFAAAGAMGIISICYLHMDLGQNGNMQAATSANATTKGNAQSTYQGAASGALVQAQKDSANIAGDQASISSLQTAIAAPGTQSGSIVTLNAQLATSEAQLGRDQAAYTTDMSSYNQDLAQYTSNWLKQQDAQADALLAQNNAQYQTAQTHDASVARISGIVGGVLAAAGTISAIDGCTN